MEDEMYVTKRNGRTEIVSFDKILKRIKKVGQEANIKINYTQLAMKVIDQLFDNISTTKIDELTSEQCASMSSTHPDYNVLAGRIIVSNHHKNTKESFYQVMKELYNFKDIHGKQHPLIDQTLYKIICKLGKEKVDSICDYNRDYLIDYFGCKTLERAYLMKINKKIVERPQHMWLRVAFGIHGDDLEEVIETYNYMSMKYFTHATPTLFNAGTPSPQLSSCYLMAMEEDSIEGIFNTLKDCALISKWAGGIGLHIHNVRASGTHIRGTNGTSNGVVPMLKVFNNTAKYVDQCVTPDTWIYTTEEPMKIGDVISRKTEIFNSEGKPEIIQNVLEHPYEGPLLYVKSKYSIDPLKITPEHPVYALQGQSNDTKPSVIKQRLQNRSIQYEFVDAKDITNEDFLVYSIPSYEKDEPTLTEEDCYMYGILLGNGCMSNTHINGYLSVHKENQEHIISFAKKYFDSNCVSYHIEENEENSVRIRWNKNIEIPYRHSDLYDKTGEKRIASRWLHLPLFKIHHIVKGLIVTDGCKEKEIVFDTTSRELVEGLRYLLLRMGVLTSGNKQEIVRNEKNTYVLRIPKAGDLCKWFNIEETEHDQFFRHDNHLLSRVQSIEKRDYHGTLYDLQMSDIHDYMIHNGIVHNGGGKRNGSFAIYLEPWHADIELFLQMRKNHGDEELKARDLFYALWVPDLFMKRVKENQQWTLMCPSECPGLSDVYGDEFEELYTKYEQENKGRHSVSARDLWFQILDSQMETGTPYLLYKDSSNQKSNQKNLGTIKSSNLCVTPETRVLTDKGYFPIYSLWSGNYPDSHSELHKITNVWNGEEFVPVEVKKTGKDVQFVKVETTDGSELICTPYHKFFVKTGTKEMMKKEANDLLPGDLLLSCSFPIIDGDETFGKEEASQQGINAGKTNLKLKPEDIMHIPVPINHKLQEKLDWFSAFVEPYVVNAGVGVLESLIEYIEVDSFSKVFLEDIKHMLQTCGVNTVITPQECVRSMLNYYSIKITGTQFRHLGEIGMQFHTFHWTPLPLAADEKDTIDMIPNIRVLNVTETSQIDDSYCFHEPTKNAGVFGGILTSQCTEIIEYSDKDETAVCNLASIALPAFIKKNEEDTPVFDFEKLHKITKVVTNNLNKVIDVNFYPTPKTKTSNMRHRPIGIGVQGLADVFFQMNLPFASDKAKLLNKHIFETIYHAAVEKSCENAIKDGPYETFNGSPASTGILQFDLWGIKHDNDRYDWEALKKKVIVHGLRNSLLLAPMPTASTSQILGYNE